MTKPIVRLPMQRMKWLYEVAGGHTHVRVFMNGGKCGDLCFRNEEFESLMSVVASAAVIEFQKEQPWYNG